MSHNASAARGSRVHSADVARKINYFLQIRNCFIINALNALTLHEIKSRIYVNTEHAVHVLPGDENYDTQHTFLPPISSIWVQGCIYRNTAGITFPFFQETCNEICGCCTILSTCSSAHTCPEKTHVMHSLPTVGDTI